MKLGSLIVSTVVILFCACEASASIRTYRLHWSGITHGNIAKATGVIEIDDTQLNNPGATDTSTDPFVVSLTLTVSNASAGNGTYTLANFNGSGAILLDTNGATLDLDDELVGQPTPGSPWGSTPPAGDFNLFSNGTNPAAPTGVDFFDLATNGGSGDEMQLTSFYPIPCADSPIDDDECFAAPKGKLQITDSATAGKDKLSWQWSSGFFFFQSDLGTPLVDTTYTVCIYDSTTNADSLATSLAIASSPTLWTDKDPKGIQYKDKDGTSDGVTKAQIKPGNLGKTKVKVSAGTSNLALPAPFSGTEFFDQDPRVVVQLMTSKGTCWKSTFGAGDTKTNDTSGFKSQVK